MHVWYPMKVPARHIIHTEQQYSKHGVIPHFIYIQIMLYSVELKAA